MNPSPEQIQSRLLIELGNKAHKFIEADADLRQYAEEDFDTVVEAVKLLAKHRGVTLDTLSMLFPDGGK